MLKDCWMLNQNVPSPALAPRLQELELSWHRFEVTCFLLARAYFLMVKKATVCQSHFLHGKKIISKTCLCFVPSKG